VIPGSGRPRDAERREALRRVEMEIVQAKAAALGRVGERLDRLLEELVRRDRELDHHRRERSAAAGHRQLIADVEARNRLRDQAVELLRALVIQREAIGLTHHAAVRERYPVPAAYRLEPSQAAGHAPPTARGGASPAPSSGQSLSHRRTS
jgi:hypothetical protein